jgi:hypothetical protein
MAKTRKPHPSFDAALPATPAESAGWAYRSDAPAEPFTALVPREPLDEKRHPTPEIRERTTPGWMAAVTTPLAIGMVIVLAPVTWWRRRS